MQATLRKRPWLLVIWVLLLLAIPIAFNAACECEEHGIEVVDALTKMPPVNFRLFSIKAVFEGACQYGIFFNDTPLTVNEAGAVFAEKQLSLNQPEEYGHTEGAVTYELKGTIDENTKEIRATIKLTGNERQIAPDGEVLIENPYTATLTLTAPMVNESTWKGTAIGHETFQNVDTTGNGQLNSTIERDLNWTFTGTAL